MDGPINLPPKKKTIVSEFNIKNYNDHGTLNEFNLYLTSGVCHFDSNDELLRFWRDNSLIYPKTSSMAVDYVSPPASSCAMERQFSIAKLYLSERRNRLCNQKFNALMLLRSWNSMQI